MRLSFALAGLAGGLALGWGATALADASAPPPAAPIFYCPTPPAQGAAATPAKAPASHAGGVHHRRVVVTRVRHVSGGQGCPTAERTHGDRHHWRHDGHEVAMTTGPGDVSASQAFIYRYERLHRGLDARAADEAWADGRGRPPMPPGPPHMAPPRMGPPPMAEAPPPPRPPMPPAPPHGDRWAHDGDGAQAWADDGHRDGHDGDRDWHGESHSDDQHDWADRGQHHDGHDGHDGAALAWQDREQSGGEHSGGAVRYERSVTEHSGGWSYSDQDGHAQFHSWGDGGRDGAHDGAAVGDGWRGDAHGAQWHGDGRHHGPQACPPGPQTPCAAAAHYRAGDHQWRDGSYGPVYRVAGRDADGYLVWPGKTPQ